MKYIKAIVFVLLIVITFAIFAQQVSAASIPSFPVCANPQGSIKSSYDNGIHGVPGDSNTYTGKDTVYQLNENQLMQCLCPTNGNGIQTDWFKASNLTEEEIAIYENQGWIVVPNGQAWGLENSTYLAKNSSFSCNSYGGTGGGGGSSQPSVLGLASTGNSAFILLVSFIGGMFAFFAMLSSKRK